MNKTIFEVLRESQKTRKQITDAYVDFEKGKPVGYCALGALACEADLVHDEYEAGQLLGSEILREYGIELLIEHSIDCPIKMDCSGGFRSLSDLIFHMNDYHEATFEQIADILEKLEKEGLILHTKTEDDSA